MIAEPPLSVGANHESETVDVAVGTPLVFVSVALSANGALGTPNGTAIAVAPVKLQAPDVNVVTIVPVSSQPAVTAEIRNQ